VGDEVGPCPYFYGARERKDDKGCRNVRKCKLSADNAKNVISLFVWTCRFLVGREEKRSDVTTEFCTSQMRLHGKEGMEEILRLAVV